MTSLIRGRVRRLETSLTAHAGRLAITGGDDLQPVVFLREDTPWV